MYTKKTLADESLFYLPFEKRNEVIDDMSSNSEDLINNAMPLIKNIHDKEKELLSVIDDISMKIKSVLISIGAQSDEITTLSLDDLSLIEVNNLDFSGGTISLLPATNEIIPIANLSVSNDSNFIISPDSKASNAYDDNISTHCLLETSDSILSGELILTTVHESYINSINLWITPSASIKYIKSSANGYTYQDLDFKVHSGTDLIKIITRYQKVKYLKIGIESTDIDVDANKILLFINDIALHRNKFVDSGYAIFYGVFDKDVYSIGVNNIDYDSIAPLSNSDISVEFSVDGNTWTSILNKDYSEKFSGQFFIKLSLSQNFDITDDYKTIHKQKSNLQSVINLDTKSISDIKISPVDEISVGNTRIKIGEKQSLLTYNLPENINITNDNIAIFIGKYKALQVNSIDELNLYRHSYFVGDNNKLYIKYNDNNIESKGLTLDEWLKTPTSSREINSLIEDREVSHINTDVHNDDNIYLVFRQETGVVSENIIVANNRPNYSSISLALYKLDSNGDIETENIVDICPPGVRKFKLTGIPHGNIEPGNTAYTQVEFIDGSTEFINVIPGDSYFSYDSQTNTIYRNNVLVEVSFSYKSLKYFKLNEDEFDIIDSKIILKHNWANYNYILKYNFSPYITKNTNLQFINLSKDNIKTIDIFNSDKNKDKCLLKYQTNILNEINKNELKKYLTPEVFNLTLGALNEDI